MARPTVWLLSLLFSVVLANPSAATVITFDEFSFPSAFPPGTSVLSQGFAIENRGTLVAEIGNCFPPCPNNGTQYLLTQVDGALRITQSNGQPFPFQSFDAAESFSGIVSFWALKVTSLASWLVEAP